MSKTSIRMLTNTQGQLNVVGERIRADGWYGYTDGLHTLAFYVVNFQGRVIIEASLADNPIEEDWFPVMINGSEYLQFPRNPLAPTGQTGDTATIGVNVIGNFTWMRARVDRSYILPQPTDPEVINALGYVDLILFNN